MDLSKHLTATVIHSFGLIAGSYTLLHNIFIVYHVDAFINGFGVSPFGFTISEIIFLIWNSINDPIFGYLTDRDILNESLSLNYIIRRRTKLIMYSSFLFCASFAFVWQNYLLFEYPSLRFGLVICLYDTALTMISLQHDAIFADLTITGFDRSILGSYSSFYQCLGAIGVAFVTYKSPDASLPRDDNGSPRGLTPAFTFSCYWIALFALFIFTITSNLLAKNFSIHNVTKNQRLKKGDFDEDNEPKSSIKLVFSLITRPNFAWFSLFYFLQVFHCHFNSNFFPLFSKYFLGRDKETLISFLVALSFIMPHLNNFILLRLANKVGLYAVIMGLLIVKVLLASFTFTFGHRSLFLMSTFICSNRMFTEGVCRLLTQIISDLVDEDLVLKNRRQPISALIFGTAALISRPGQTFAPLVGIILMRCLSGEDLSDSSFGPTLNVMERSNQVSWETMESCCFVLATTVAIITGILQIYAWNNYELKGARLAYIKRRRELMEELIDTDIMA